MKIMICGKGGSGKSTVAALLAAAYAGKGNRVLVVDLDESNYGLHRQLGMDLPEDFTGYFGSKKGIFAALDKEGSAGAFPKKWSLEDIPEEFLSRRENISLLAIGKIHEAGEGCACPMGTLARCFLDNLELKDNQIVIIDAEAGIEHFGRGVDTSADVILMVVDPSFESLHLTWKVDAMGRKMGKPLYFILNKATERNDSIMRSSLPDGAVVLSAVPNDPDIALSGLTGDPLRMDLPQIREIMERLEHAQ